MSINSFLENGGKKTGPRTKILYQTCNKVDSWNTLKTRLVSARMKENVSLSIYLKVFYSNNKSLYHLTVLQYGFHYYCSRRLQNPKQNGVWRLQSRVWGKYQSSKLRISNEIFISWSSNPLKSTNFLNLLLMPFFRHWAQTKWCEQSRWSTPWAWRGRSTGRSWGDNTSPATSHNIYFCLLQEK